MNVIRERVVIDAVPDITDSSSDWVIDGVADKSQKRSFSHRLNILERLSLSVCGCLCLSVAVFVCLCLSVCVFLSQYLSSVSVSVAVSLSDSVCLSSVCLFVCRSPSVCACVVSFCFVRPDGSDMRGGSLHVLPCSSCSLGVIVLLRSKSFVDDLSGLMRCGCGV